MNKIPTIFEIQKRIHDSIHKLADFDINPPRYNGKSFAVDCQIRVNEKNFEAFKRDILMEAMQKELTIKEAFKKTIYYDRTRIR